ncbi:hypothetical protein [Roseomonas sp. BN140053]|uniref:hypothetical protein n=1 Tax=Roseomonas sp. BN140053 TaxID=3391898 RepID=UPI0039EAFBCB
MIGRRHALLLPLLAAGCGGREPLPDAAPPRLDGYAWLTPLRLNVAEVEVEEPAPGGPNRVDPPAPLVPAAEVVRMARDRLGAGGTTGRARFAVEQASLTRERLGGGGLFSEPSERLTCVLRCRVEILNGEGRRVAFAEAEARRTATLPEGGGTTPARNAGQLVARAMDDLNVEFELQVRRNLRDWLQETAGAAPVAPTDAPGGIQREDLSTPRAGGTPAVPASAEPQSLPAPGSLSAPVPASPPSSLPPPTPLRLP